LHFNKKNFEEIKKESVSNVSKFVFAKKKCKKSDLVGYHARIPGERESTTTRSALPRYAAN
jgi:hypothetical protein